MIYIALWSRKIGLSHKEMSCMPIGELDDMISGYQILNGIAEEVEEETYIPALK